MTGLFRRLGGLVRPGRGRHRRQPWRRAAGDRALRQDEAWIGELLERTPPPPAGPDDPWPPRITRYVRLTHACPGDTVFLPPVPAAAVLNLMARGFAWDPR